MNTEASGCAKVTEYQSKSKIHYLYNALLCYDDIGRFYIAMDDVMPMRF